MVLNKESSPSNKNIVILSILAFLLNQVNYVIGIFLILVCIFILIAKNGEVVFSSSLLPLVLMGAMGIVMAVININNLLFSNIIKDISYFFRPILIIYFGYVISLYNKRSNNIGLYKFIVIYSVLSAVLNLVNILINYKVVITNFTFLNIREVMGHSDDIMVLGFTVLIFFSQYYGKKLFSRNISKLFTLIFILNILVSFSRTKILTFFIMVIIFMVINPQKNIKLNNIRIGILITVVVMSGILYFEYGDINKYFSFLDPFMKKIMNSMTEISAQSDWNNYAEIVHNWRGYEIYSAKQLLNSFAVIEKVFGAGLGTLIPVLHSDLVGVPLSEGGIILLHNGYYTILIKTGIAGLLLYLMFFGTVIIKSIRCLHRDGFYTAILVSICIEILMNSYTTTGITKSIYSFGMLVTLGYMIWRVEYENNKKI